MKRLSWLIRLFRQDEKGNVLIIVAASLVLLMGMAALAIDVGGLYGTRRQAVNAADAAALAAALEKNENSAEGEAVKYANENYNAILEGIEFTYIGPGKSQSESRITTVLVSRNFSYSFARVLGFDESDVYAMASVQRGVGNGLVPFAMEAVPCYCCYDCYVSEDPNCPEGEDCECICVCTEPDGEGECGFENDECDICKLGYEDKVWKVLNEDGVCAKPGDELVLKVPHPHESPFESPGNFHLLQFPDDPQGLPPVINNIGGGYDGDLDRLKPGTPIGLADDSTSKTGNAVAIESALESRYAQAQAEDDMCETLEDLEKLQGGPYSCDLVVVVPLVVVTDFGGGVTIEFEIKGYASFLLDFSDGVAGDEVKGILFEYLTYDELLDIYGAQLVGYVYRLIEDPIEAKEELLKLTQ